jgi:alpha-tubulin suppressor-like RCC1 family protein
MWAWQLPRFESIQRGRSFDVKPVQIGADKDWASVAGDFDILVGLKTDGSLWEWSLVPQFYERMSLNDSLSLRHFPPTRLGIHKDWLAVDSTLHGVVSLAADGSLWHWQALGSTYPLDQPLLTASRKPARIENILDHQ